MKKIFSIVLFCFFAALINPVIALDQPVKKKIDNGTELLYEIASFNVDSTTLYSMPFSLAGFNSNDTTKLFWWYQASSSGSSYTDVTVELQGSVDLSTWDSLAAWGNDSLETLQSGVQKIYDSNTYPYYRIQYDPDAPNPSDTYIRQYLYLKDPD